MSVPSNPGSSRISREDAGRAVDALLGFLRARSKQRKAQLFEHDDFLYLHISIRRFPSTSRLNPYRIPLPHTLHPLDPSRTSLCLIADDSLAETARSTAAAENLPFDSVIPLSELRTDYVPFESRRRLCDSYDIFFAERRIITFLPRLIGNCFFKKKKIPLAVNISRPGWPEAVRQACRSTLLFSSSGTCIGMKVGRVSMDREDIIDNLMAAIDGAVDHVPKKWANVRCMYIKAVQSVALPIYQVVPEMGTKIDVGSGGKAEPLDRVVVQARDVKRGVEEKSKKKRVVSKKRKGRIHDVDYIGAELVARSDDDDADGAEEKGNHELGREKKMKKKKEGNGKLSKGKKGSIDGDDEDGCGEKESGGMFIELGTERKKRKRAKKIVNSEAEVHALKDGLAVAPADDLLDGKDLQLKKKVKSKCKRSKGKKGKQDNLHGSSEDLENIEADEEVNLMNVDTAIATAADDEVAAADVLLDGKDLQLKKKVESKCKRSKGKKGKKDNLHGSSEVNLVSVDTAIATAAADGDHVDDEVSHVEKRVKNNGKIGKDKKVKKVKKTKL